MTDPDSLPGIDEQLLASGEHEGLVRYLVDRHGLDEDEARQVLADLDGEDDDEPCTCPECHAELVGLLHDVVGPPTTTLVPRPEYL